MRQLNAAVLEDIRAAGGALSAVGVTVERPPELVLEANADAAIGNTPLGFGASLAMLGHLAASVFMPADMELPVLQPAISEPAVAPVEEMPAVAASESVNEAVPENSNDKKAELKDEVFRQVYALPDSDSGVAFQAAHAAEEDVKFEAPEQIAIDRIDHLKFTTQQALTRVGGELATFLSDELDGMEIDNEMGMRLTPTVMNIGMKRAPIVRSLSAA